MAGPACLGLATAVALLCGSAASATAPSAVHRGCPPGTARVGYTPPRTVDQVVAAAYARIVGTVTHYQGRAERRTRQNTPVLAVIVEFGSTPLRGSQALFRRAARRCGPRVASFSGAVLFHEGLSVVADATITEFVVKTNRGWWAYGDL